MGAEEAAFVRQALASLMPPLGLAWLSLFALLLGLAWRRRRMAAGMLSGFSLAVLLLMSTPWAGQALIDSLERRAGEAVDREGARRLARAADGPRAIVVLGGGIRTDERDALGPELPLPRTLERLRALAVLLLMSTPWAGQALQGSGQRELGSQRVAVSGGRPPGALRPEAEVMAEVLEADFRLRPRWVEPDSLDTASNARLLARQLKEAGIGRVVLVTHAYHMPRARAVFETAGLRVDPAPVGFLAGHGASRPLAFLPSPKGLQLASLAMHEWLGIAWYRFNGHIKATP
jgi:uncharacterized SAM-binding protein YcdF (DUF218 family)